MPASVLLGTSVSGSLCAPRLGTLWRKVKLGFECQAKAFPKSPEPPPGGRLGPPPATGRSVHLAATMRLKQENAHPAISLVADNQGDVTS